MYDMNNQRPLTSSSGISPHSCFLVLLRGTAVVLILASGLWGAHARASSSPSPGDPVAAGKAFRDAQTAQLAGDHARAAESFELAHANAPSPEALRSAARARLALGEIDRAANHALELRSRYRSDADSYELAEAILSKTADRLVELRVRCESACTLAAGGRALALGAATEHHLFVRPGVSEFRVVFDAGRRRSISLNAKAGHAVELTVEPPPELETQSPAEAPNRTNVAEPGRARRVVHPGVTLGAMVATLGLGGATLWSGLDTRAAHDEFETTPSEANHRIGREKQLRTNVLIGVTAGVAAATILVAAIWTDWGRMGKDRTNRRAHLELGPTGLRGRF